MLKIAFFLLGVSICVFAWIMLREPMEKEIFANETTAAGRAATLPDTIPTQANVSSKTCWEKPRRRLRKS